MNPYPKIRRVQPSDAAELLHFLSKVGKESDMLLVGPEGPRFNLEQETAFLSQLQDNKLQIFLVAEVKGRIVARSQLTANERERIAHWGRLSITVAKDYWRQGIAGRMMEEMLGFAKTLRLHAITLEVRTDNVAAIKLYEKFGFQTWGTFKDFFCIEGCYYDAYYMNLYLN